MSVDRYEVGHIVKQCRKKGSQFLILLMFDGDFRASYPPRLTCVEDGKVVDEWPVENTYKFDFRTPLKECDNLVLIKDPRGVLPTIIGVDASHQQYDSYCSNYLMEQREATRTCNSAKVHPAPA
jgi:hypothetical protein